MEIKEKESKINLGEDLIDEIAMYMKEGDDLIRRGHEGLALPCYKLIITKIDPVMTSDEKKRMNKIRAHVNDSKKLNPIREAELIFWKENKHMNWMEAQGRHLHPPVWNPNELDENGRKKGPAYTWNKNKLNSRIHLLMIYLEEVMHKHGIYLPTANNPRNY